MDPVSAEEFGKVLSQAGLQEADPSIGIGRELSFTDGPSRTIVVHLGTDDPAEYFRKITNRVLSLENDWLLVPRHGSVSGLRLLPNGKAAAAIRFTITERAALSEYLCTRPMDIGAISCDLYALSGSGKTLLTWDHHTEDDGLCVQLQRVSDATALLTYLNEFGAELNLFYAEKGTRRPDV
jgi:hypothetical protein